MKLLRLKLLSSFRSLQKGFELDFLRQEHSNTSESALSSFSPYVLAGPNGSGKSNVLEVLAAIVYHMECMYLQNLPDSFVYDEEVNPDGYQSKNGIPDAFELEYLVDAKLVDHAVSGWNKHAHVRIAKRAGHSPQWFLLNAEAVRTDQPWEIGRTTARSILPRHVLAYSSGENQLLSLPFFKMRFINFDEYTDALVRELSYDAQPEGRLVYLDDSFSQAILICNLLLQPEGILRPFAEEVGVEDIKSFRIIIREAVSMYKTGELADQDLVSESISHDDKIFQLTTLLNHHIQSLKACATCYHVCDKGDLYLDYLVTNATREAFQLYFGSALNLFRLFQLLLTLNLYTVSTTLKKELYTSRSLYVNETVPVLASDQRIMRFKHTDLKKRGLGDTSDEVTLKNLSDGEHQFLHALGLCLLYREENALFLLDEPETHFNPAWRAQFISRLRQCFVSEDEQSVSPEVLITTHSPFLISDSEPERVLVFDKQDNTVTVERPDYNTLGASINQITLKTFNKRETIGGYAQQKMDGFKQRFDQEKQGASAKQMRDLITEINQKLGDSVEKVLLLRTILDAVEKIDGSKD